MFVYRNGLISAILGLNYFFLIFLELIYFFHLRAGLIFFPGKSGVNLFFSKNARAPPLEIKWSAPNIINRSNTHVSS